MIAFQDVLIIRLGSKSMDNIATSSYKLVERHGIWGGTSREQRLQVWGDDGFESRRRTRRSTLCARGISQRAANIVVGVVGIQV